MNTRPVILSGLPLKFVQLGCVLLIAVKLAHWSFAGVFMDEAYYWMWGQHLALSYYDHPPLNAWLLGLSSSIFGWNVLALRLPVVLTFIADVLALYLIARRIGGDWRGYFWLTLLLFLATPVFSMVSNYALPDHVLLAALLLTIYFFLRFFMDRAEGRAGETRDLLLGAVFLGLGGLAKYNAAFLGVGIGLFVLFHDRALLGQLRLYLAAAVTLLMQLPVIVWNVTERLASFNFILNGRHAGLATSIDGIAPLLLGVGIFIGPFLLWPIGRFAVSRGGPVEGAGFARATFAVSSVAIVALAFTTLTLFHWNLAAYAAMLPFLAFYMRSRWLVGLQAIWGVVFAVGVLVNYAFVPITDMGGWKDEATAWSYDWSRTAQTVEAARAEHPVGFVAAADYTTASLLAFALRDRDVVSLSPRQDQYDYWFDAKAHAGENAILYGDRSRPITRLAAGLFDSVEEIGSVMVSANGYDIYLQRIYLAKGFKPQ